MTFTMLSSSCLEAVEVGEPAAAVRGFAFVSAEEPPGQASLSSAILPFSTFAQHCCAPWAFLESRSPHLCGASSFLNSASSLGFHSFIYWRVNFELEAETP